MSSNTCIFVVECFLNIGHQISIFIFSQFTVFSTNFFCCSSPDVFLFLFNLFSSILAFRFVITRKSAILKSTSHSSSTTLESVTLKSMSSSTTLESVTLKSILSSKCLAFVTLSATCESIILKSVSSALDSLTFFLQRKFLYFQLSF